MSAYQVKNITAAVVDVDESKRVVTGYFSQFGSVDSDNDMIMPGAFTKTIQENGADSMRPRIVHLYQHDVQKPLGKPRVLREDDKGLYFETEIIETTYGSDVLKLYAAGVINEHSIGFNTVKAEPENGYNKIYEVRLYEGSTVTFGANPNTPFLGFKGWARETAVDSLRKFQKAVRNGTFTDETFELLEIQLKQLEQYVETFDTAKPPDGTLHQPEPPNGTTVGVELEDVLTTLDAGIINLHKWRI